MTEADVARECDALAIACGWRVERYEQRRASRITRGLPDRRYVKPGLVLWIELKAPKGKLTAEQHGWLLAELAAGGLATVVDGSEPFRRLLWLLGRSMAKPEATRFCRELIDLTVARGYRAEAA